MRRKSVEVKPKISTVWPSARTVQIMGPLMAKPYVEEHGMIDRGARLKAESKTSLMLPSVVIFFEMSSSKVNSPGSLTTLLSTKRVPVIAASTFAFQSKAIIRLITVSMRRRPPRPRCLNCFITFAIFVLKFQIIIYEFYSLP